MTATQDASGSGAPTSYIARLFHEHEALFAWLGLASFVMFVGSLLLLPWLVARIPSNYFAEPDPPPSPFAGAHPVVTLTIRVARNLVGTVLLALGVLMLVLPGQGLVTMMVGLMLLDFPGKRALEIALIRRRAIHKALDWLRAKAGRGPLELPVKR